MDIKISVIIPVYNMQEEITKNLKKIIMQKGNFEFIVVDDGSKDNSFDECSKIAQTDKRVKVFHIENQGAGGARNYGISRANGKYLYFPDADDSLVENALDTMYEEIEKSRADLLVFGYKSIRRNGEVISEKTYREIEFEAEYVRNNYSDYFSMISKYSIQGAPWNKLFSASVVKENEIVFPLLRRHQDEAFIGRYMNHCKAVKFIPNRLYIYNLNELKNEWDKYPNDYIEIVKELYQERKKNILIWNENDTLTHSLVEKEFLCNVVRACEFSFSRKRKFNMVSRYNWIKKQLVDNDLKAYDAPQLLGRYPKLVLLLLKHNNYLMIYIILLLKVFMTQTGVYYYIKRLQKSNGV